MISSFAKKVSFIIFILCFYNSCLAAQNGTGLILPMPGKTKKVKNTKPKKKITESKIRHKRNNSSMLIPLPEKIKRRKKTSVSSQNKVSDDTIITIKKPEITESKAPEAVNMPADDLKMPDEIILEPDNMDSTADLLVSGNDTSELTEIAQSSNTNLSHGNMPEEGYPIFPKDTSSAIFMVMKTWKCDDYDGNMLLENAVKTYGEESVDNFQIKGLSPEQPMNVSIDEEDITLDELLDILATKSGRDWGVDIPSKVIYFYPQGIKTGTVNDW